MDRPLKIVQAGPQSIHLENFCRGILPHIGSFDFIGEEEIQYPGLRQSLICSFRSRNPLIWILNYFRIRTFLKSIQPDLIHIHQANRLAFVVSRAAYHLKIPVITTAWGSDVLLVPKKNFIFKAITKRILKHSNTVTGDSLEMISAMKRIYQNGRYVWIQYGIDPIEATQKEKIIYSNRLHKKLYRIDTIIQEFAEFSKNHPDWMLYIAATGDETPLLQAQTAELHLNQQVVFLGWQHKIENDQMYARSQIYVSIPSSDGTSVSLLEAMSAGCIPVVSDIRVSLEWIEDKKNGIIYRPGENPFEEALKIDRALAVETNTRLIHNKALRTNTSKQFFDMYLNLKS